MASQCIAHWVKDQLSEAGADTSRFKVHSVRGAVTSVALNKGVTSGDILQMANWSSDSTFTRIYYHPTHDQPILAGKFCKWSIQLGEEMLHSHWSHLPAYPPFCIGLWTLPVSHAVNLTKYNYQFGEGPRGSKASWNYMSEMSKCDTALPPTLHVVLFFPFSQMDMQHGEVVKAVL